MEIAHISFSRGLCVPQARKSQTIVYKSVSLYLHRIFLRQNASDIQTPPKDEEAKYLQTRLQCILLFCGSEGQKDNVSSSHDLKKKKKLNQEDDNFGTDKGHVNTF